MLNKPDTIDDKVWLELQIIAAVSSLKIDYPEHPFVIAIRAVLDKQTTPQQMEMDLQDVPAFLRNQAD